jgi:hypothetical protein
MSPPNRHKPIFFVCFVDAFVYRLHRTGTQIENLQKVAGNPNCMNKWMQILDAFLLQAQKGELKTSSYYEEWSGLKTKVSFGMGAPARIARALIYEME